MAKKKLKPAFQPPASTSRFPAPNLFDILFFGGLAFIFVTGERAFVVGDSIAEFIFGFIILCAISAWYFGKQTTLEEYENVHIERNGRHVDTLAMPGALDNMFLNLKRYGPYYQPTWPDGWLVPYRITKLGVFTQQDDSLTSRETGFTMRELEAQFGNYGQHVPLDRIEELTETTPTGEKLYALWFDPAVMIQNGWIQAILRNYFNMYFLGWFNTIREFPFARLVPDTDVKEDGGARIDPSKPENERILRAGTNPNIVYTKEPAATYLLPDGTKIEFFIKKDFTRFGLTNFRMRLVVIMSSGVDPTTKATLTQNGDPILIPENMSFKMDVMLHISLDDMIGFAFGKRNDSIYDTIKASFSQKINDIGSRLNTSDILLSVLNADVVDPNNANNAQRKTGLEDEILRVYKELRIQVPGPTEDKLLREPFSVLGINIQAMVAADTETQRFLDTIRKRNIDLLERDTQLALTHKDAEIADIEREIYEKDIKVEMDAKVDFVEKMGTALEKNPVYKLELAKYQNGRNVYFNGGFGGQGVSGGDTSAITPVMDVLNTDPNPRSRNNNNNRKSKRKPQTQNNP